MTSIHSESFPRSLSILFHVVAAIPLSGFALFHFRYGSAWLSVLLTAALVTVLLSLAREIRHRDSLAYRQVFVLLVSVAIVYACYQLGLRGLIYVFPMASVFFFTFRLNQALITGVVFSAASLLAVLPSESPLLVFRFSVGVAICLIFAFIFAYVVDKQKAALAQQANVDALTGSLNRRGLNELLEEARALWARHNLAASLLLIDLDHFKQINDRHGHLVGDQILVEFSRLLNDRVRQLDKVIRFGGEEFLVLLPGTTGREACRVAEELRQMTSGHAFQSGIRLTCSLGVAELQAGQSVNGWLHAVDTALYEAKRQGRDRVVLPAAPSR